MKDQQEKGAEARGNAPAPAAKGGGSGVLSGVVEKAKRVVRLAREMRGLPPLTVHLMYSRTEENEEFFRRTTRAHYEETQARHPKFPLIKALEYGFAVKILEDNFDGYFMSVDGSARRNFKKAVRNGFEFGRFNFNDHIEDIREILRSTPYRQGKMPDSLVQGKVKPVTNPETKNAFHDYPFYAVKREGVVVAYAGCLVAGEICMIQTIYGHADHHSDGVVPLLIISIVKDVLENYPQVKYYGYGTTFGATENLQRFKKKFRFMPMRVKWELE